MNSQIPGPLWCPLCRKQTTPCEVLPRARLRCNKCKGVFQLSPAALMAPTQASARKKTSKENVGANILGGRKKQLLAAGGALAGFLLGWIVLANVWSGPSGQAPVFPARGEILYKGQKIPNALLVLHPVGLGPSEVPHPRCYVREDGSFVLGTYSTEDGAPAGEYTATVQWNKTTKGEGEGDGRLVNQLPDKYARAATSKLHIRILEEPNEIPTIRLE